MYTDAQIQEFNAYNEFFGYKYYTVETYSRAIDAYFYLKGETL